ISEPFIALSQQTEAVIRALAHLPEQAVPGAFDFAIRNNLIPAQTQAQRDELLKRWSEIIARFHEGSRNYFQQLLNNTTLNEERKNAVADLFTEHQANIHQLFDSIDKNHALDPQAADE